MIGRSTEHTIPPVPGASRGEALSREVSVQLQRVHGSAGGQGKASGGFGDFLASKTHETGPAVSILPGPAGLGDRAATMLSHVSDAGRRGLLRIRGCKDEEGARVPDGFRGNAYYMQEGENLNPHFVIHTANVPQTSAGLQHPHFFRDLGDPRHAVGSLQRNAEQEYLLQNMAKGPMLAASQIAARHDLGMAVRGTGLLAHMGIEAGQPTKAQEFKNKTSKEIDLWLCDELQWGDIGAVVHFDPRVGWSSEGASKHAVGDKAPMFPDGPTEQDWQQKLEWILKTRAPALASMRSHLKMPSIEDLKEAFLARANEYREEDAAYRHGDFQKHTTLTGPYIHLTVRPDQNMVGDHDLFVFVERDGSIASADRVSAIQKELQESHEFQAQHGAVLYWNPNEDFHQAIKGKIVNAHEPQKGAPLVVLWPDGNVVAAYFNDKEGKLASPWDLAEGQRWLEHTWSGRKLLEAAKEAEMPSGQLPPARETT
ncbi:MAG: hypothetical protein K0Q43_3315 [Ramlibacter sp.]|nr:hypothetical protein [Ramlibacter sp.]